MITLQVNNKSFQAFESARVFFSMATMAVAFEFTTTAQEVKNFPIEVRQACKVFIDGELIVTGFIEGMKQDYNKARHAITFLGRSKTADVIDSSVGSVKEIIGGAILSDVIRLTLIGMGITGINVIDEVGDIDPFTDTEIISADVGDNAFEFLEKYARKRQVLLGVNGNGDIILTRNSKLVSGASLINRIGGKQNNIISADATIDESGMFNTYVAQSQLNPSAPNFAGIPSTIADQGGTVITTDGIRAGRRLEFNAEETMDTKSLIKRATWEADIRRAKSKSVTYQTSPFSHIAGLWRPNRLVKVDDDLLDIRADMLIRDITYFFSVDAGSTVSLVLVPSDAYLLEASTPAKEKKTNIIFGRFFQEAGSS